MKAYKGKVKAGRQSSRPLTAEEIPLTSYRTFSPDTSTDDEGSPRHIPYPTGYDFPMRHPYVRRATMQQPFAPRINVGYTPSPLASPARTNNISNHQYR